MSEPKRSACSLPMGSGRTGVSIRDQKLADVLAEFSRAKERPVSTAFWQANLKVMEQACDLTKEILTTLLLIHEARRESPVTSPRVAR
jgi:hypothetical protein